MRVSSLVRPQISSNTGNSVFYLCFGLIALGLIVFAFCFTTRLVPVPYWDRGVYTSVGERLLAGDKLYRGVYDNKDPLFYYLVAFQRYGGPLVEYFIQVGILATSFIFAYMIARTLALSAMVAAISGFVGAPLIITGTFYRPMSYIPAIALSLLVCLLFMRGKLLPAGMALGALTFCLLIMTPLPLAFCLVYAWILDAPQLRLKNVIFAGAGYLLFSIPFLLFLIERNELLPYVHNLALNTAYTRGPLLGNPSFMEAIGRHFTSIFLHEEQERILSLSTLASVIFMLLTTRGPSSITPQLRAFCYSVAAAILVSVLVISLTGVWYDHILPMYFANTLLVIYLTHWVFYRFPLWSRFPAIAVISMLLAGSTNVRLYLDNPLDMVAKLNGLRRIYPEAAALISETHGSPVKYARLGMNEENGSHAIGLRNYKLVCPDFHQYEFYSRRRLSKILDCTAGAPVLIVSNLISRWDNGPSPWANPPYADLEQGKERWNEYVGEVEEMLSLNFICKRFHGGIRICRKPMLPGQ